MTRKESRRLRSYTLRRLQITLLLIFYFFSSHAALASDWEEEDLAPRPRVSIPSSAAAALPPFSDVATPGTIASSGLRLHFAQAIDALELEIFSQKNSKSGITERLDLLEKTIFGETMIEELPDNMQRLHRLLSTVPLSDYNVVAAAGKADGGIGASSITQQSAGTNRGGFWKTMLGAPRDAAGGANRVLHSPTFWTLVGVAGALVCGYLLARSINNSYYENPCVNRANPNAHYVRPVYNAQGQIIRVGHMQSNPNATMTDNFSAVCNVNPYTGQLGYVPSWR